MVFRSKGAARADANDATHGKTHPNDSRPNSHFAKGGKAFRLKGRNRFKTGRKSGKR